MPPGVLDKFRAQMNAKIQEGLDDLARGDYVDGRAFMTQLKRKLESIRSEESPAEHQAQRS